MDRLEAALDDARARRSTAGGRSRNAWPHSDQLWRALTAPAPGVVAAGQREKRRPLPNQCLHRAVQQRRRGARADAPSAAPDSLAAASFSWLMSWNSRHVVRRWAAGPPAMRSRAHLDDRAGGQQHLSGLEGHIGPHHERVEEARRRGCGGHEQERGGQTDYRLVGSFLLHRSIGVCERQIVEPRRCRPVRVRHGRRAAAPTDAA